jgi:hypothetical protein
MTVGHNPPVPGFFFFLHSKPIFQKKKTLVLTLGSPPEKGGGKKKKNPGINHGQMGRSGAYTANPPEKGRKIIIIIITLILTLGSPPEKGGEQKKNPGIYTWQPAGKGRGKEKKKKTLGNPPDLDFKTWTDRQRPVVTDGL